MSTSKFRVRIPSLLRSSLLVLLCLSLEVLAQEKQTDYLTLSVGIVHDQKVPNAPADIDTAGTYRNVTNVQYDSDRKILRFIPKKVGVATFIMMDKSSKVIYEFTIDVRKTDLAKVAREIKSLLSTIEGITIRVINNKVIVDGQILLPTDMRRIHNVVKQYGDLATSIVSLSPVAQNKIAQFIERKINNPEVRVSATNNKFILEGMVDSTEERGRAEIIAKMYVPDVIVDQAVAEGVVKERKADVVINLIGVRAAPPKEPEKIIQMVVHYVELKKDYNRGFKFQWTPGLGEGSAINFSSGGQSPGGIGATITGTINNLIPKLNWAKEHGFARVLQSTSVIVEDKKQGTINSVTRVPYMVPNQFGQMGTQFVDTGLKFAVTPQVMGARSDSVKLDMNFSVTALINQSTSGPLTSSREVQTSIHVRSGQSAAVGGLITNDTSTDYNRTPAGAENPIISLFASKDFRRNQSQFVVFVTPVIKSSASAGTDEIKRKFRLAN